MTKDEIIDTSSSPHYDEERKAKLMKLISKAPKAQLHLHLDGSLSYETIKEIMKEIKTENHKTAIFEDNWEPSTKKEMVNWFIDTNKQQQIDNLKAEDGGNWKVFDVCNKLLQTKKHLTMATFDLVKQLYFQHHVNYTEIRFAPVLHCQKGLTEKEVCHAVIDGFVKAKHLINSEGNEFYGGIILCALRSFPVAEAIKTVNLITALNSEYILGFDIAGDEGSYSLKSFEEVLRLAKSRDIKITVHAGEWNEQQFPHVLEGLKLAVDVGVNRLGHGIALRSFHPNDDIFVQMKAKNIAVEICLTSNCDNKTKCASFEEHPLLVFLKNKVNIAALNVDNLMLAGDHETGLPTPTGEFVRAICNCKISNDDILQILQESYSSSFYNLPQKFIDDSIQYWRDHIIPHLNKQ